MGDKIIVDDVTGLGLPNYQLIIIGTTQWLKQLTFEKLRPKLGDTISEELFTKAQEKLTDGSLNVYLDLFQMIGLSSKCSRHNTPSQALTVSKQMKSASSKAKGDLCILAVVESRNALATVCAIGRAFPLYSRKTKPQQTRSVRIEVMPVDKPNLEQQDIAFLNDMVHATRNAARLVDMPCSELNTLAFVEEARRVAAELKDTVEINVIQGEELREKGFGGIYNVGKCAKFPPSFVSLSYTPEGATQTYCIVGKGIVYDTGGMQLKTKTGMPGMKRDMGGAAAVMMSFWAAVRAGFRQNLHCLLCLAENMIGPEATRPDDIITLLSGKTAEVNNTDAEGRLVLADGVFFAHSVLKANVIIDLATLTGAQATATGNYHGAFLTNSDTWEKFVGEAGRFSGDLVHPLPYAPDIHFEYLSSSVADMKNSNLGKSEAASAVAGLFVAAQIDFPRPEDVVWLHVDMAAPVYVGERATGYGPALILSLLGKETAVPILLTNSPEK